MTTSPNDFNREIIDEFRSNEGRVGRMFAGAPMVLLTTTGAKSGRKHTTPLMSLPDGDRTLVFASMGGAPRHPAWYRNLLAHPEVEVEEGTEKYRARADVITGDERDRLFERQAKAYPQFAEYQKKTTRTIPVIALHRIA